MAEWGQRGSTGEGGGVGRPCGFYMHPRTSTGPLSKKKRS